MLLVTRHTIVKQLPQIVFFQTLSPSSTNNFAAKVTLFCDIRKFCEHFLVVRIYCSHFYYKYARTNNLWPEKRQKETIELKREE